MDNRRTLTVSQLRDNYKKPEQKTWATKQPNNTFQKPRNSKPKPAPKLQPQERLLKYWKDNKQKVCFVLNGQDESQDAYILGSDPFTVIFSVCSNMSGWNHLAMINKSSIEQIVPTGKAPKGLVKNINGNPDEDFSKLTLEELQEYYDNVKLHFAPKK